MRERSFGAGIRALKAVCLFIGLSAIFAVPVFSRQLPGPRDAFGLAFAGVLFLGLARGLHLVGQGLDEDSPERLQAGLRVFAMMAVLLCVGGALASGSVVGAVVVTAMMLGGLAWDRWGAKAS